MNLYIEKFIPMNNPVYVYDIDANDVLTCRIVSYVIQQKNNSDELASYMNLSNDTKEMFYPIKYVDEDIVYNGILAFSSMDKLEQFKNEHILKTSSISQKRSIVLNLNHFISQDELKTISDVMCIIDNTLPKVFIDKNIFISVDNNEPNDYECIMTNNRYLSYIVTGVYINIYQQIIVVAIPKEIIENGNQK